MHNEEELRLMEEEITRDDAIPSWEKTLLINRNREHFMAPLAEGGVCVSVTPSDTRTPSSLLSHNQELSGGRRGDFSGEQRIT